MAVDNVEVSNSVDSYGNSYTNAISNDKLTNEDFLNLMIEELKNQDPTNPMDTAAMMDNQLKMSQMESNLKMSKSMNQLQAAFESSALAGAANMIGRIAEMEVQVPKIDAETGEMMYDEETGEVVTEAGVKEYQIQSIIKQEGELFGKVNEIVGLADKLYYQGVQIPYTSSGFMYENGELTDYRVQLDENKRVVTDDNGKPIILNEDGEQITDEEYLSSFAISGTEYIYGEEEILPLSSIIRIS
jgi:flagellar basal-body rod modification protein FlgD